MVTKEKIQKFFEVFHSLEISWLKMANRFTLIIIVGSYTDFRLI